MTEWNRDEVLRVLRLWLTECPTDKRHTLTREQVKALVATPVSPPTPEPMDFLESQLEGSGYSIIRGWLAIHGGASARIVKEEISQMLRRYAALSSPPPEPREEIGE